MAQENVIYRLGSKENPKGSKYDITANGKFAHTRQKPRVIVIHWGGHSAENLSNYFRTTGVSVSAHWAVDETGCWQMLDHSKRAYHAGWINTYSVGFDIAAQPTIENLDKYLKMGRDVKVVPNPTKRGEKQVLTLDPRIAENTRRMTFWLCEQLDIPLVAPRDADGKVRHDVVFNSAAQLGDFTGVIGHHHCSASKWDVAPWWGEVFDGTALGDPKPEPLPVLMAGRVATMKFTGGN